MTFRIVCLALFFYFGHCSASELMIYRWVDKNNIVHFSQHQPVGDDYTEFLVSNQSKIISRADDATTPSMSDKSIYISIYVLWRQKSVAPTLTYFKISIIFAIASPI